MNERRYVLDTEQHRDNAARFIGKLDVSRPIEVIIQDYHKPRSLGANGRLWLLHRAAAAHTGYSADEMHEHALCRHYGYTEKERINPLTGEIEMKRVPNERSSGQNSPKFKLFMDATEAWYIDEFGVWLDQQRAA